MVNKTLARRSVVNVAQQRKQGCAGGVASRGDKRYDMI